MFGSSADMNAAVSLARHLFPIDPMLVKRLEPVYSSFQGIAEIIDYRPVEYGIEEQHYMKAYELKNRRKFEFLVRPALSEGDVQGGFHVVSIANLDKDIWVDESLVAKARELLSKRIGIPLQDALAASQRQLADQPATMPTAILESGGEEPSDEIEEDDDDLYSREPVR